MSCSSSSESSEGWDWSKKSKKGKGCGCKGCRKGKKCKRISCIESKSITTKQLCVSGHKVPSEIFDKDFTVEVAMDATTLVTTGTPGTFGTSFSVRGVIFAEGAIPDNSGPGFIGLDSAGNPNPNLAQCVIGEWILTGIWTDTYPNPNPTLGNEHPNVFGRQLFNFTHPCFFGDIITDGEEQTPRICPWQRVIVGGTHKYTGIRGTQLQGNIPNSFNANGLSQNATFFSTIPNGSVISFNGFNFRVSFCSLR